jgi:peptide deformylase
MLGTFRAKQSSTRNGELSMQAIVEKVMRALAFKYPVPDDEAKRARQEATEFAAELLKNYKSQLARRMPGTGHH